LVKDRFPGPGERSLGSGTDKCPPSRSQGSNLLAYPRMVAASSMAAPRRVEAINEHQGGDRLSSRCPGGSPGGDRLDTGNAAARVSVHRGQERCGSRVTLGSSQPYRVVPAATRPKAIGDERVLSPRSSTKHRAASSDDGRRSPSRSARRVRARRGCRARGVESVAVSVVAHDFAASSSRSASSRSSSMESFTV
jgi:hypothetical protein